MTLPALDDGYPRARALHAERIADIQGHMSMLREIRSAVLCMSHRLDDEIASRRLSDAAIADLHDDVRAITVLLGEPPDCSTGTPGSGMRGQWVSAINAVLRARHDSVMPASRVRAWGGIAIGVIGALAAAAALLVPLL